ncbi:MAG: GTP 3',8-cyclase [Dehalococcoidia bacterium]|nr:GTP 3',8-cyclase [Chloroflexota bacterium]MBT9162328.1 GTP 3',8-cyclase [Chloroflexota bacterium]
MTGLSDFFNRPINYLRISVTDRCNLRCVYCMPPEGITLLSHGEILSYEEICLVARAASELGISKVRLTGGEPLVRAHLSSLIRMLARIEGIDDLSLTTNGVLLGRYARELKAAGLKRVNISLDSLRPQRFERITRMGKIENSLQGIEAARAAGLHPIKINMVVMRGVNDDEIADFARLTREKGWHVRFIEFMPIGEVKSQESRVESRESRGGGLQTPDSRLQTKEFVPISEIMERIESLGILEPHSLHGNGPARYFRLPRAEGTIGFISPVSEHFCFKCNRLRLTAEGKLRPCLLCDEEIDLREPLCRRASVDELKCLIEQATEAKPSGHRLEGGTTARKRAMCQIGG